MKMVGMMKGDNFRAKIYPSCSLSERAYYVGVFGFDPDTDRIAMPLDLDHDTVFNPPHGLFQPFYYQAVFPLASDPPLAALGVTISARVELNSSGFIHNQILFTRDGEVSAAECIHTIVHPGNEGQDAHEDKVGRDVGLPPWGHFAALKMFVGGLAELGV